MVIAPDTETARNLFEDWVQDHREGMPTLDIRVELVSRVELAQQPQLRVPTEGGVASIAYWLGHRTGWWTAAPHEPQIGSLAPFEPMVSCFAFDYEAEEVLCFANDEDAAWETFRKYCELMFETDGDEAICQEIPRWLLQGPQVTLREDMDHDLCGVGAITPDGFWHIYHPESEAIHG